MNIKPLADRVLILPAPAEEKKIGSFIIPVSAAGEDLTKGEVVAVGRGTKDEEMILKVGDKVLFGKRSGQKVDIDEKTYLIMHQIEVLAII